MIDKRDTVAVFRSRLGMLITRRRETTSAFARRCKLDRSALSQFLDPGSVRLPRAETLTSIAVNEGVSIDWLLGISQDEESVGEVASLLNVERGQLGTRDSPLAKWHSDAIGYKIRYSPLSIPDLLRTEAVTEYEFDTNTRIQADVKQGQSRHQLDYSRKPETDMETVVPMRHLQDLASGTGAWAGLSRSHRKEQFDHMIQLIDELYPTFRLFLYDGRAHYCAPFTLFGPKRAAVFLGDMYLVINSVEHIRELTNFFDNIIRHAVVGPDRSSAWLKALKVQ
ncbi:MAG: hypothetical protein ABF285_01810 [Pacificibacter sp.]|uniref:hypothetical protein n=1 Tax=Pacificibacter sp. TaxID=1917866 RepID=UPI00321C1EB1